MYSLGVLPLEGIPLNKDAEIQFVRTLEKKPSQYSFSRFFVIYTYFRKSSENWRKLPELKESIYCKWKVTTE